MASFRVRHDNSGNHQTCADELWRCEALSENRPPGDGGHERAEKSEETDGADWKSLETGEPVGVGGARSDHGQPEESSTVDNRDRRWKALGYEREGGEDCAARGELPAGERNQINRASPVLGQDNAGRHAEGEQWAKERPDVDVSGMEIIGRLSRLERAIRPRLEAAFAEHDLESWEFDVLATLRRSGEPHQLTPGQLLNSMMVTSGAMTNRIDRLEQRKFVQRSPHPTDKRQVLVTLTKRGRDKVDTALIDHAANELALIDVFAPEQRQQLAELLRILNKSLTEPATPSSQPTQTTTSTIK